MTIYHRFLAMLSRWSQVARPTRKAILQSCNSFLVYFFKNCFLHSLSFILQSNRILCFTWSAIGSESTITFHHGETDDSPVLTLCAVLSLFTISSDLGWSEHYVTPHHWLFVHMWFPRNRYFLSSALSFRKLTSMKIVDRSSCYIVGIKKDMADKALLAKYELFGRFGDILSIRIIQDKDPCEVYIRFATQASALRAIDWCNSTASLFMNAKHGYQKYCIKFINGQNCKRSNINCPNRHSWADTKDILTFKNSRLVPNAVVSNSVEEGNYSNFTNLQISNIFHFHPLLFIYDSLSIHFESKIFQKILRQKNVSEPCTRWVVLSLNGLWFECD